VSSGTQTRVAALSIADAQALLDPVQAPDVLAVAPLASVPSVTATYAGATHTVGTFLGASPGYLAIDNDTVALPSPRPRPSGAPRTASPNGTPPSGRGYGFRGRGGVFSDPKVQAALKACGITVPTRRSGLGATPTPTPISRPTTRDRRLGCPRKAGRREPASPGCAAHLD